MPTQPLEPGRRKAGARGTPARLADGDEWLFAHPFDVDGPIDRIFDRLTLGDRLPLADVWEAARALLLANYDLDDAELADLLEVGGEAEARVLADSVLDALFGPSPPSRSYSDWVCASMRANGLDPRGFSAAGLADVLNILVATGRTVPLAEFADACRAARQQALLDTLI